MKCNVRNYEKNRDTHAFTDAYYAMRACQDFYVDVVEKVWKTVKKIII